MTNINRCTILLILTGICLLPFFFGTFDIKGFKPSKDIYPVVRNFADRILKNTNTNSLDKEKEFTKASYKNDETSNLAIEKEKGAQISTINGVLNDILENDKTSNFIVEQKKKVEKSEIKSTRKTKLKKDLEVRNIKRTEKSEIKSSLQAILKNDGALNKLAGSKKDKIFKLKSTVKAIIEKDRTSNPEGGQKKGIKIPDVESKLKSLNNDLRKNLFLIKNLSEKKKDKKTQVKSTVKAILKNNSFSNLEVKQKQKKSIKKKGTEILDIKSRLKSLKNDLKNLSEKKKDKQTQAKSTVKAILKNNVFSNIIGKEEQGAEKPKTKSNLPLKKSIQITTLLSRKNITFEYTILPRGENKAKIIQEEDCPNTENENRKRKRKPNKLILVTNYIAIDLSRNEYFMYDRHITKAEEEARIWEILSTYQTNLNNPSIDRIYIFVQHSESVRFLKNTAFENSSKLALVRAEKGFTMYSIFRYISKCLRDRVVVYTNMDIVIGEGFERINTTLMKEKKVMYALTRYSKHDYKVGTCEHGRYDMSHDTFVFYVRTMTKDDLKAMEVVKGNEFGMESLIMHLFRHKLGYKVLNPCKVLYTYHEHQVHMRKKKSRLRVEEHHNEITGITNKLSKKRK